jgi:hypothetical protein
VESAKVIPYTNVFTFKHALDDYVDGKSRWIRGAWDFDGGDVPAAKARRTELLDGSAPASRVFNEP